MQITTKISQSKKGKYYLRGHNLLDLIAEHSFADVLFLLWRGDFPQKKEAQFLEALLVAAVEHGVAVPSLYVPRVVASTGNDMHTALAAGMLAIGTKHGGAIETAAYLFTQEQSIPDTVTDYLTQKVPLPGFGHRLYTTTDPRAKALYDKAKKLKLKTLYFDKAYLFEKELKKQKGKTIPLNIDGAMAAGLLDLNLDPTLSQAFFLLARLVGMAAHVKEEFEQKNPYYRLEE